jgi:hypothetical protein
MASNAPPDADQHQQPRQSPRLQRRFLAAGVEQFFVCRENLAGRRQHLVIENRLGLLRERYLVSLAILRGVEPRHVGVELLEALLHLSDQRRLLRRLDDRLHATQPEIDARALRLGSAQFGKLCEFQVGEVVTPEVQFQLVAQLLDMEF